MNVCLEDNNENITGKGTGHGLYYYNARWYDPQAGKFISEDPIRDGSNWYNYCSNNPLKFIDPTGLIEVESHTIEQETYIDNGTLRTGNPRDIYNDPTIRKAAIKRNWESMKQGALDSIPEIMPGFAGIATPAQFTYLGLEGDRAQELSDIQNKATINSTIMSTSLLGTGFASIAYTGSIGMGSYSGLFTSMIAAGSSSKIAGGSASDIVNNVVAASAFGWIPGGNKVGGLFTEGGKAFAASTMAQLTTSGKADLGISSLYFASGFFSQLGIAGGSSMDDIALENLGKYGIPFLSSLGIELGSK